jgi:hypothetical protein
LGIVEPVANRQAESMTQPPSTQQPVEGNPISSHIEYPSEAESPTVRTRCWDHSVMLEANLTLLHVV